jgi:hypothetical protein
MLPGLMFPPGRVPPIFPGRLPAPPMFPGRVATPPPGGLMPGLFPMVPGKVVAPPGLFPMVPGKVVAPPGRLPGRVVVPPGRFPGSEAAPPGRVPGNVDPPVGRFRFPGRLTPGLEGLDGRREGLPGAGLMLGRVPGFIPGRFCMPGVEGRAEGRFAPIPGMLFGRFPPMEGVDGRMPGVAGRGVVGRPEGMGRWLGMDGRWPMEGGVGLADGPEGLPAGVDGLGPGPAGRGAGAAGRGAAGLEKVGAEGLGAAGGLAGGAGRAAGAGPGLAPGPPPPGPGLPPRWAKRALPPSRSAVVAPVRAIILNRNMGLSFVLWEVVPIRGCWMGPVLWPVCEPSRR